VGVKKYVKKPVVVEAIELTWGNWNEVCDFMQGQPIRGRWVNPANGSFTEGNQPPHTLSPDDAEIGCIIQTPSGDVLARQGDYIVRDVQGNFYPCVATVFAATYDEVAGNQVKPSFSQPETMQPRMDELTKQMDEQARERSGQKEE
jgi:hypothetical protein